MTTAMTTAAIMAISVVMNGASAVGSSGSIGCAGDGASVTTKYVISIELA